MRVAEVGDMADVEELPESVRVRARAVWMVFPDASEKGELGGREEVVGEEEGCKADSESWRCMRRSVCRLFWNQTVTDRTSLCRDVSKMQKRRRHRR